MFMIKVHIRLSHTILPVKKIIHHSELSGCFSLIFVVLSRLTFPWGETSPAGVWAMHSTHTTNYSPCFGNSNVRQTLLFILIFWEVFHIIYSFFFLSPEFHKLVCIKWSKISQILQFVDQHNKKMFSY